MEFRGCAQIGRRLGCLILHNLWAACEGSLSMSMLDQHCWYCAFNNFRNFKVVVCSWLEWCKFLCYWWQLAAKCITCTSSNLMIWLPFGDHLNPITTWFVVWISFKHWGNMVFLSLSLPLLTLSFTAEILLLSWWRCCNTFKIFSAHKMHILRLNSNLMRRLLWLQIQFSNIHVPEICRDSRRDLSIFIIHYIQHNTRKDNIF